jgi:hypothetical protein
MVSLLNENIVQRIKIIFISSVITINVGDERRQQAMVGMCLRYRIKRCCWNRVSSEHGDGQES